jgi:hypothetical protein
MGTKVFCKNVKHLNKSNKSSERITCIPNIELAKKSSVLEEYLAHRDLVEQRNLQNDVGLMFSCNCGHLRLGFL